MSSPIHANVGRFGTSYAMTLQTRTQNVQTRSNVPQSTYSGTEQSNLPAGYSVQPAPDGRLEEGEGAVDDRGQWGSKAEFILSCVGLSVGLGNVWRFPYLAYKNGGAAFLIAYLVLQLLIGKPMYFMELVMGQYSGKGPTKVWDMNPSAKGIGVSMCLISLVVAIYYNIIMAYTLIFFFSSMQSTLPWTECTEEWIRDYNCVSKRAKDVAGLCQFNETYNNLMGMCTCTGNTTIDSLASYNCTKSLSSGTTAAELFFEREVIQRSSGIDSDNIGAPLWKLALCLLLSWLVVVFCLIKGIKSSGKVVYFTATFPYIILLILLVRGAMLDGAKDGVEFFLIPEWKKLTEIGVWVDAAGQMFFSLSVSFGGIIMFGSYNKFKNQVYYDSLFISVMDLVTSIIAGFVVFTTFGGMAKSIGTTVDKVAKGGYGLAFVVYPEALSNLPPSQLWSVLFFFMLFTLGLDSEFGLMETILTCIQDEMPSLRKHKSKLAIGMGIICYLLALPCTCPGGDYVVTIMDHYGATFSVLFLSAFEVISVMWVYGVMNFLKDIEYMLGSRPHGWVYWVFTWTIAAPILITGLVLYEMITYESPQYPNKEDFPEFAQNIGWVLTAVVLSPVALWFFWRVFQSRNVPSDERLDFIFKPTADWGPNDGKDRYLLPENGYPMAKTGIDNPVILSMDKE